MPLLGSSRQAEPQRKRPVLLRRPLPLLGSNQDSPDPYTSAFAAAPIPKRSWSGLCLRLRPRFTAAVRRFPSSLYTFRRLTCRLGSALAVKRPPTLRTFTRTVSGVMSSATIVRVRRVASYTKGQCSFSTHFELLASGTNSEGFLPSYPWSHTPAIQRQVGEEA